MEDPRKVLPRTVREIEAGMAAGLHIGAQVYVSLNAEPLADFGVGQARQDISMTKDTMMAWYSSTKAVFSIALAQQWEKSKLDIDDLVCKYIPEYGKYGKEIITLRHLLTHTAGVRYTPGMGLGMAVATAPLRFKSWDEFIGRVCEAQREPDWTPGQRAGYMGGNAYAPLTEVLQRITGQPYSKYARENIFEPIGAVDSWVGMPKGKYEEYGDRIGIQHNIGADRTPRPAGDIDSPEASLIGHAGGSGRGPMRELGRVYEILLLRGTYKGKRIISPQSVEAITAPNRVGMFDETFLIPVDWALGYMIDHIHHGRFCSRRSFGHGGGMNSHAFCDPEWKLVVAMVFNGNIDSKMNALRMEAVASAIYRDLNLILPGDQGRDHPVPPNAMERSLPGRYQRASYVRPGV